MSELCLTPTSYIVLGLLEPAARRRRTTSRASRDRSLGNFWSVPHAQLYTETARLAEAGCSSEKREEGGRRRKLYRLTETGRAALPTGVASQPTSSPSCATSGS